MKITQKTDFRGRMYWSPVTCRIWLKSGKIRDLGPWTLDEARSFAVRFGLILLTNGRQNLPTDENGLISGGENEIATVSKNNLQRGESGI